jgi:hypothetical protein
MTPPPVKRKQWLVATTDSARIVIHLSPITASWVLRAIVNDLYNVAGTGSRRRFDPCTYGVSESHTPEIDVITWSGLAFIGSGHRKPRVSHFCKDAPL